MLLGKQFKFEALGPEAHLYAVCGVAGGGNITAYAKLIVVELGARGSGDFYVVVAAYTSKHTQRPHVLLRRLDKQGKVEDPTALDSTGSYECRRVEWNVPKAEESPRVVGVLNTSESEDVAGYQKYDAVDILAYHALRGQNTNDLAKEDTLTPRPTRDRKAAPKACDTPPGFASSKKRKAGGPADKGNDSEATEDDEPPLKRKIRRCKCVCRCRRKCKGKCRTKCKTKCMCKCKCKGTCGCDGKCKCVTQKPKPKPKRDPKQPKIPTTDAKKMLKLEESVQELKRDVKSKRSNEKASYTDTLDDYAALMKGVLEAQGKINECGVANQHNKVKEAAMAAKIRAFNCNDIALANSIVLDVEH
jgi:hypothetical protein